MYMWFIGGAEVTECSLLTSPINRRCNTVQVKLMTAHGLVSRYSWAPSLPTCL